MFFNLSVMSSVVQVICQKPNKSESDSLFDVIFFSPKSKSTTTTTNETEAKNVTSLALTFDDGFEVKPSLKDWFGIGGAHKDPYRESETMT